MEKININIAILGCESVGKTTFYNTLSGKFQPEIQTTEILGENKLMDKTFPSLQSFDFNIENLDNYNQSYDTDIYHNLTINVSHGSEIEIDLYDIPGFNKVDNTNNYHNWITDNLKMFDLVIFMTDIDNALQDSKEINLLKLIIDLIKNNNSNLICLLNKCDEIYFDENENDIIFRNKNHEKIFIDINNHLSNILLTNNISYDTVTPFLPISSENSLIFRTILNNQHPNYNNSDSNPIIKNNTFQYVEKIKDTGYIMILDTITKILQTNREKFIRNKLETDLKNFNITNRDDFNEYIKIISTYAKKIIVAMKSNVIISYELFWNTVKVFSNKYIMKISNININEINKPYEKLDSINFMKIYSIIDFYDRCAMELLKSIEDVPEYPVEYFVSFRQTISNKFHELFKIIENKTLSKDINPIIFVRCLETINRNCNEKFDYFARVFLTKCIDENFSYHETHQNELFKLLCTIKRHSSEEDLIDFSSLICSLFINRCKFIQNNQQLSSGYFYYLLRLKKIIKTTIKKFHHDHTITPYDILLEALNMNILSHISACGVTNIYKQSLDICKIKNELEKITSKENRFNFKFEEQMFNIMNSSYLGETDDDIIN